MLRCWDRWEIQKQEKLTKQVRSKGTSPIRKTSTWLNLISKMGGISVRHRQGLYRDMEQKSRIPHLFLGYNYVYILNRISAPPHAEWPADVVCASGQDTTWKYPWGGLPGKFQPGGVPRRTSLQRVRSGWLSSSSGARLWLSRMN